MRSQKNKNYGLVIGVLVLAAAFRIATVGNEHLARLPVDSVPQNKQAVPPIDTKNLYPVVIRQKRSESGPKTTQDGEDINPDVAFVGRVVDDPAPAAPPPPNLEAMFREAIIIDAITPLGAFVRGTYYSINAPMDEFTISNGTVSITPRIVATRSGAIDIRYGKNGRMTIRVPEQEEK